MAAHNLEVRQEISIAGVPFSDTKKTMQEYWYYQGKGAEFELALTKAAEKLSALPQEITLVDTQMKELDPSSDVYKELAGKKKKLEDLQRGLKRNLPRHTDPNVGLDASAAALVWIGVHKKDGTVEPHVMIYDSARKDATWAGKSLVAINGKIEIEETDPRHTMVREVQEELLNSPLSIALGARTEHADINQAPNYSTNSIAIERITSGQDCYLNQTSFVFGGIYEENELNEELNKINASMERLLGSDTAPASLFIKNVLPGPQPATACKNAVLAKQEILQGLAALLAWHNENDLAVKCPLTQANYVALAALYEDISSGKLDLSAAKDVAVVKKTFEEHVYCYTEARKVHLLSKDEFCTVAHAGKVMTNHGEVSMPGFIHRPLGIFLAKEKENSSVYGHPGSPALYKPAPAVRNKPSFEQWLSLEIEASTSKPAPAFN